MKYAFLLMLTICLALAVGCHAGSRQATLASDQEIPFTGKWPAGQAPTYDALATRHNQRLANIKQFSAQSQIELIYHDAKGKRHYEQADQCRVMLVRPRKMALLVRKFGVGDLFLAGSNDERYWLFDLTDSKRRLLYLGQHDVPHASAAARRLPIPVQPQDLPRLMGLAELDPQATGSVAAVKGGYLITSPDAQWRMVLDPETWLPVRVELLDADHQVYMTSLLARPAQVELFERSPIAWPRLMSRIEIRPRSSKDRVIVHLSGIDDGIESESIQDRAFELDRLIRTYKPDEVIDLDMEGGKKTRTHDRRSQALGGGSQIDCLFERERIGLNSHF